MSKPQVYRSILGDWVMLCEEHGELVTTYSWNNAYETAMGHVVMRHGSPRE